MQRRKLASENVEHKNNNELWKFLRIETFYISLQTPVKGNVLIKHQQNRHFPLWWFLI